MKNSIMNNSFIQMHQLRPQIDAAVKFINRNKQYIITGDNLKNVLSQKTVVTSPIEALYGQLKEAGLESKFILVDFTHAIEVPDIFNLAIAPIFVDGKLVINITQFIKQRRFAEDKIVLSDIGVFHGIIVRGIMIISYEQFITSDDNVWIDPNIMVALTISYSMIMTYIIPMSQDLKDIETVKTIFTWFFMSRVQTTSKLKELSNPPLLYQCKIDLTKVEIDNVLNEFLEGFDITKEMTVMELCRRLLKLVPSLPKSFDDMYLLRIFSSGMHADANELMVGLSYPPYWFFHIIKIQTGIKDGHGILIKRFRLQKLLDDMVARFLRSKNFLEQLK